MVGNNLVDSGCNQANSRMKDESISVSSMTICLHFRFCDLPAFTVFQPILNKTNPERFSDVEGMIGYVPQTVIPGSLFPLLLSDVNNIDENLVGWEDSEDPQRMTHNVIYDIEGLANRSIEASVFSIVKHWRE